MRRLHVAVNGWFAGEQSAGSGQYLDHLLAALARYAANLHLSIFTPPQVGAIALDAAFSQQQALQLPRLPANLAKLWWEQVTVPRAALNVRADVIWVPYWAAPLWQPAPVTVTIHDLIPLLLPAYRGGILQRGYTRLVNLSARRAAAIIAVSHATARDIVSHLGVPAARVHVVHHGPNQADQPPPALEQLQQAQVKYRLPARYFLYLGGFDIRKNVQGVLGAYQQYLARGGDAAVKLVLAGRLPLADTAFFPDPRRMAAELQLGDQVHFCGWVDEADKPALYALATAFFFPSHYEGFGMMVLEAMQAGTPVVTG